MVLEFEEAVRNRPEVLECYTSMGDADYLLKLAIADVSAHDRFLQFFVFKLKCVIDVRSNFALRTVKQQTALPMEVYKGFTQE